jgi:hypothetical protein
MQVLLADVSSCFYSHRMSGKGLNIEGYRVEPLSPQTWDEFASLAERHNGVRGRVLVHLVPSLPGPSGAQGAGEPRVQAAACRG